MYSKCVQPKLILIGQIVKLIGKWLMAWPIVILYSAVTHFSKHNYVYSELTNKILPTHELCYKEVGERRS